MAYRRRRSFPSHDLEVLSVCFHLFMITSYIPHDPGVESYLLIDDAPALGAQNDGAQGERGTNVYENFYDDDMP